MFLGAAFLPFPGYGAIVDHGSGGWAMVMVAALWWGVSISLVRRCWLGEQQRCMHLCEDMCDPEPLLEWARNQPRHRKNDERNAHLWLTEGAALLDLGRVEEARQALEQAKTDKLAPYYWSYEAVKKLHLCNVCLLAGDRDTARWRWQQADELFRSKTPPVRERSGLAWSLTALDCSLRVDERQMEGVEQILEGLLSGTLTLRQQVALRALRGKLLQLYHRPKEAAEDLRFVVENGNKLHARARAEEQLKKL